MATYPKIADNEMNYFQFKARQMLLLRKEDHEWQEFCNQVAPDCAACKAEKTDEKKSKEVGIQANSRTPFKKFERPSLQPRHQNEQIPETLNNIRIRLENIDLALSKIYDTPTKSEKEKKHQTGSILKNAETFKLSEEQKRNFIRRSLRKSLEKIHTSASEGPKKPPAIKLINSSYFLPHDLQIKRVAARKAYLASLQTKPKVSFQNVRRDTKKNVQSTHSKKVASKIIPKPRKKAITKRVTKQSNDDKQETLIATEDEYSKDENIEYVVDAILNDLIGEAALDLNRIKQKKREREFLALKQKMQIDKERETGVLLGSEASSPIKNVDSQILVRGDNRSITKLKKFLDSPKMSLQNERKELFTEGTSTHHTEDSKYVSEESDTGIFQPKQFSTLKAPPKFVCDVSHIITISPEKARDISSSRKRYWEYLKKISRTVKGNFNPWVLNNTLAESILDDCITDIAEELSNMPSTFVQDLYNQEFMQQVED